MNKIIIWGINKFIKNKNKIDDYKVLIELNLILSFNTFGQIYYVDENKKPKIIEFKGSQAKVTYEMNEITYKIEEIDFKCFINNQTERENEIARMTLKVNNNIIIKQTHLIKKEKLVWLNIHYIM